MIETVGLIGVGKMGYGIATNILRSNEFKLLIMGRNRKQETEILFTKGAMEISSPSEMATRSDAIILCLPSSVEVEEVVLANDGILAGSSPGLVIIDCSTSLPESTLKLTQAAMHTGTIFMDAPLTRSPIEALEGRLNCLVGSEEKDLRFVEKLLMTFCENIIHVGGVSYGHRFKLVNNSLTLGMAGLVAESIMSAKALNLNLQTLRTIISLSSGNCSAFQGFMNFLLEGDQTVLNFSLKNALKDLHYFDKQLQQADYRAPISTAAASSIESRVRNGATNDTLLALVGD